jgi:hypothetical protein
VAQGMIGNMFEISTWVWTFVLSLNIYGVILHGSGVEDWYGLRVMRNVYDVM